jgi:hypothetical protein
LCSWIHERFARDQHELLIRQLYKIKQEGSVQKYIDKFCELVDQLQAYSHNVEPLYYTTRFIDGLRSDIKYFISVQRPRDFDTACCLALLQEDSISMQPKEVKKYDGNYSAKNYMKGPFPLPRPPVKVDSIKIDDVPEDKNKMATQKNPFKEDKLTALSAYRMVKGLYRKCGGKWHKGYKCADSIQLNAIQEVWDLIESDSPLSQDGSSSSAEGQLFMAISEATVSGTEGPRTMKIKGSIQHM